MCKIQQLQHVLPTQQHGRRAQICSWRRVLHWTLSLKGREDEGGEFETRPGCGWESSPNNLVVPKPFALIVTDFLKETTPYFMDRQIAILQTPQFFRHRDDQTWVEKGAGVTQELFYRMVQVLKMHVDIRRSEFRTEDGHGKHPNFELFTESWLYNTSRLVSCATLVDSTRYFLTA